MEEAFLVALDTSILKVLMALEQVIVQLNTKLHYVTVVNKLNSEIIIFYISSNIKIHIVKIN
jgi:hypothetical protein